jgi:hypothetical protein
MRKSIAIDEVLAIPSEGAKVVHISLLSGEIIYRLGDNTFTTTDYKLNEDVRVDSISTPTPVTIYIKGVQASELQYRRE